MSSFHIFYWIVSDVSRDSLALIKNTKIDTVLDTRLLLLSSHPVKLIFIQSFKVGQDET